MPLDLSMQILSDGWTVAGTLFCLGLSALVLGPILFGSNMARTEPGGDPYGGRPAYLARKSWAGVLTAKEETECARLCELGVLLEQHTIRGNGYRWHHYEVNPGHNYRAEHVEDAAA